MQLNRPPLFERLKGARSVLIAGAGGGFDLFTGIPLFLALRGQGVQVHLASLSFAYLDGTDAEVVTDVCRAVTATTASDDNYFPERALAEWLLGRGIEQPIYAFELDAVAARVRYLHGLLPTRDFGEVVRFIEGFHKGVAKKRPWALIPV